MLILHFAEEVLRFGGAHVAEGSLMPTFEVGRLDERGGQNVRLRSPPAEIHATFFNQALASAIDTLKEVDESDRRILLKLEGSEMGLELVHDYASAGRVEKSPKAQNTFGRK